MLCVGNGTYRNRTHRVRTIAAAVNKIEDANGQQHGEGKVERR